VFIDLTTALFTGGNMKLHTIPVAKLEMAKPADGEFDKEFAGTLATSIKADGLLHNPIVTPVTGKPDFFRVVSGKHRIYAVGKILGWTDVECFVADATEVEALESIELAANVFVRALTPEQKQKSLIRWHELYVKRYPTVEGKGAAQKTEAAASAASGDSKPSGDKRSLPLTKDAPGAPRPFAQVLESTLGVSAGTAKNLARVAKNLTEDDITVLAAKKVTNEIVNKIAALGKGEAVSQAVKLIGSGMNHDEAVRQAAKLKPEKAAKAPKPGAAPRALPAPKPAELTDDEWLRTFCATPLSALKHKTPYKRDAILYRRIQEALLAFRRTKKHVEEAKDPAGHNGAFFANCWRLVKIAHPQHWQVCGICRGDGKNVDDATKACPACLGAAYRIKLED
jgi:hypothetical protein